MRLKNVVVSLLVLLLLILVGCSDISVGVLSDLTNEEYNWKKEKAIVERVVDGDTIIVKRSNGQEEVSERVRLLLIDTPESVHPEKEPEYYGEESSDYVRGLLKEGDSVTLEIGEDERDKYDRLLAHIWIDDMNLNKHLVEEGYARVAFVFEPNTKYVDEFYRAEGNARKSAKGVWSVEGYVTENGFDMSIIE